MSNTQIQAPDWERSTYAAYESGYIVPVWFGESRMKAAKGLLEDQGIQLDGPDERWSREDIIALARTAHPKPVPYFNHVDHEDLGGKFGGCFCEDPTNMNGEWSFCSESNGDFLFSGWFFDAASAHLEACVEVIDG